MIQSLPVINLNEARFECTYGRGCDGLCCQNSRPPVSEEEAEGIERNLDRILPLLRPSARKLVEKQGFLSRRRKSGWPMLRVVETWCVFFHEGCVLHKLGAQEGDKNRYKPAICALFPIERNDNGEWYVRQKGLPGETWDLFCLDPSRTSVPASESLKEEVEMCIRFDELAACEPSDAAS